jgi:hypothetical protein
VNVLVLIVEAFIASPKVAVTAVLGQAPLAGITERTVGAPTAWHAEMPVVKVHTSLVARTLPNMSLAAVVIVAVYVLLRATRCESARRSKRRRVVCGIVSNRSRHRCAIRIGQSKYRGIDRRRIHGLTECGRDNGVRARVARASGGHGKHRGGELDLAPRRSCLDRYIR